MRTLFWKIFAWFGVAQLLLVVAFYLLAWATARGFDERVANMMGNGLQDRTRSAALIYENAGGGTKGLQQLRSTWTNSPFRRGGLRGPNNDAMANPDDGPPPPDDDGGDGPPPDNGEDAPPFNAGRPERFGGRGGPRVSSFFVWQKGTKQPKLLAGPSLPKEAQQVVRNAFLVGSAFYTATDDDSISYIARRAQTASGARYIGVEQISSNSQGHFWGPLSDFWRIDKFSLARFFTLGGLLMVGLCFGLARYLSAPATKLRTATHQFAEGDLTTRVGPLMGKRRDELADLGRDFDAMAERIEDLVTGQGRLLGDISHELRTPLARLNVAVELALDSAEGQTCAFLDRIKEESAELDALIGQLLTLQRLESRTTTFAKVPLDLSGLVAHIAEDIDFEARSHGTRVEVMHLDDCQMEGNAELLKSAVQNITRNAVLHAGGERVEVLLEREVAKAVISVRDFGSGVPEEALEKIFDPFYRVDSARPRQSGGTGLGMSITKRAVEAHGGTVKAQNAVNGGLLVQICLPLAESDSCESSTSSQTETHPDFLVAG